jgi:hypothetical protein
LTVGIQALLGGGSSGFGPMPAETGNEALSHEARVNMVASKADAER